MARTVKILSIDGGGIRGIIPATVAAQIEKNTGQPVSRLFDLIAGTSTGGILALGLTKPNPAGQPQFTAQAMADLYAKEGATIFSRPLWYRMLALGNLSLEKYPSRGIEDVLGRYFGDISLRQATTDVLVTSYEIEKSFPFFFRSSAARVKPDYDFLMRDVARATSAAPTYFQPLRVKPSGISAATQATQESYTLIDGGVYANNPAACALVEARATHPDAQNFFVVSLGTGHMTRGIPYNEARHWGVAGWVGPLLDVVFDGVSSTVDYQLRQLFNPCAGTPSYYRFQPALTRQHAGMDNASPQNVAALQSIAHELVASHAPQIDRICEALAAAPDRL